MLYFIATPIGNLGDFSFRAVEVLKAVDYILCEDTRHSRILLDHYQIKTPLKSFHKFNARASEASVIADLRAHKEIALISDAGTPLISDPGKELVTACQQEGLAYTAIPGACALLDALLLSGFPTAPFQFVGFLPKQQTELHTLLVHLLFYPGTTIAYEAPHRLLETLSLLLSLEPTKPLCVARELTKHYEEVLRGTPTDLLQHFEKKPPRGELVLLLGPGKPYSEYDTLSPQELVETLKKEFNLSQQEAIKIAAQWRHLPKRALYNLFTHD